MLHQTIVVGPFQCNCAILADPKTREAVVIDPGDEPLRIIEAIEKQNFTVKYLLHTHAHLDHIGGTAALHAKFKAPPCLHQADEFIYNQLPMQGRMFGMQLGSAPAVEKFLEDEEILEFGEHRLQVIHTPGHSPGGVCFRKLGGEEMLFSGDTLFQRSVGRTDLWGGDYNLMIKSIKSRLMTLEGDLPVHPGHGPSTRIGEEKKENPFL